MAGAEGEALRSHFGADLAGALRALTRRWQQDEAGWHALPPRAWPARQPKIAEAAALREQLADCAPVASAELTPACARTAFELATALLYARTTDAQGAEGLERFRELARPAGGAGAPQTSEARLDARVAVGVALTDSSLGCALDHPAGVAALQSAADAGHAQARYELASLHYTGAAGLKEDERRAAALWERCAAQDHTGCMYMLADCLREGAGVERDVARAVPLLAGAASKGHRFARQVLAEMLRGAQ